MRGLLKQKVRDYNIAYSREGSGEPVLFVHGITTYSFIWRKITRLISPRYDAIAIDLLGCGDSDKPLDEDYSIKNQSEIIAEFIDKLKLGKVHLVSHDIGGGIAQILAVNHPELLLDITLINSVAYDFWPVQPIIAMRTPIVRQLAMSTLDFGIFKIVIKRGFYDSKFLTDELMSYFWEPMKSRVGRKAFLHLAEGLNNKQLLEISDRLHSSDLPFLIIRGENDVFLSAAIANTLHKNLKKSKLVQISAAGHFIMEETPGEIVVELIDFFEKEAK